MKEFDDGGERLVFIGGIAALVIVILIIIFKN